MDLSAKTKRQKLLIILSHLIGKLGSGIFAFGIGLMILRETGSASNFGFSQLIGPVTALLLLPFTGSIIDKVNHKRIVVVAQLCSIGGIALFLLANYFQVLPRLSLIYLLLTVLAVADLFLETTYSSSMISMVEEKDLQQIMSLKQIVQTICMIAAPILGAMIYQLVSFELFVILEIASEVLTLGLVLGINFYLVQSETEPEEKGVPVLRGVLSSFKEGVDYVRSSSALSFMVAFSMLVNFLFSGINVGLPFVKIQVFKLSNAEYGITQAVWASGFLLAGVALAKYREVKQPMYQAWRLVMLAFAILLGIALLIFLKPSHMESFIGLIVLMALIGVVIGMINIPISIWSVKNIPQGMQGRVFNLIGTLSQLLMPLGILFFSFFLDYPVKPELLFAITSVLGVATTLLLPKLWGLSVKSL